MKTPITPINFKSWTEPSGTFMTNFSKEMFGAYRKAVEIYEQQYNSYCLYVHDKSSPVGRSDGGSMHYWNGHNKNFDLMEFWKIVNQVKDTNIVNTPYAAYERAMKGIKP